MIPTFTGTHSFLILEASNLRTTTQPERIFVPTLLRMIRWGGLQKIQEVKAEASSESWPAASRGLTLLKGAMRGYFLWDSLWEYKQRKTLQVYVFFFGGPKDVMEIGFITNGSLIYIFDSNIFSTICLISGKTTAHLVYSRICF